MSGMTINGSATGANDVRIRGVDGQDGLLRSDEQGKGRKAETGYTSERDCCRKRHQSGGNCDQDSNDEQDHKKKKKKKKKSSRKMGLNRLRATVMQAKQGFLKAAGFVKAVKEIIVPWCAVLAKALSLVVRKVLSGHICRIKNASCVPYRLIAKEHYFDASGHTKTIFTVTTMLHREIMPGAHTDVSSGRFETIEGLKFYTLIHCYPMIAGEYPVNMYENCDDKEIFYRNGLKAEDVATTLDDFRLVGENELTIN